MLRSISKQSGESGVMKTKRKATVGRIYDTIRDAILRYQFLCIARV